MGFFSENESDFLKDLFRNLVIFLIIALAALALSQFIIILENYGFPSLIIKSLTLVEYLLFIADLFWFIVKILGVLAILVYSEFKNVLSKIREIRSEDINISSKSKDIEK